MKQSRLMSIVETVLSTAIGFAVAFTAQLVIFPLFGFNPPLSHNLLIGAIFTAVSIARGYFVRRLFEALHIRTPLSPFMLAVIAERHRQIEVEGWSAEHDDNEHAPGELARAGAAYAIAAGAPDGGEALGVDRVWPWGVAWWKPTDFRRDLVKAAALIVADGERHDRTKSRRDAPAPSAEPTSEQAGAVR